MANRPCPICRTHGHDSNGDHLFLMKDGETWACFHKEYHGENRTNYFESAKGGAGPMPCSFPSQRTSTARETVDEVLTFPLLNSEYRGIRGDTFRHFEVRVSFHESTGQMEFLYFPLKSKGKLVGFHRRSLDSKAFSNIGGIAGVDLDLFGMDKCAKTGKNIIITEGHLDALSTYQVIKDKYNKINPNIVSVNNGLGSIKDIAGSVSELNAYDTVLLSFDMDQPGRDGIAKVAKLLGSRIKIMELSCKDANEALTANKGPEIINAIFHPREYVPSDVVTLHDLRDSILAETPQGLPWEWEGLSDLTYGIFSQQIISIGAAPGAGKTIFINQLSSYLMRTFKKKIALFSLEETPTYTGKKLVGSLIGKRLHLPGVKGGEGEVDAIVEELKDFLYIYDTQGFLSWEDIKTNIRYLASLGVEFFVIDPLTAVTAMCSASEANEVLNGMMADLSTLVQSLNATVFLVSHLNNPKTGKMHSEGGQVSGEQFTQSRALQRWSHVVIGLERNLQSEDEEEKNTLIVRIIKSRLVGKTGTVSLRYQEDTGRLEEVDDSSYGV